MSTATTQLPPGTGIYYIVVAGGRFESQRLTQAHADSDTLGVTILPPSVGNDHRQEVIYYFHDELDCLSLICPFT